MKKEYNLTNLKKRKGKIKTYKNANKISISLRIDGIDLSLLKSEAEMKGLPYQTLLGSIVHQYVTGELIEKKTIELLQTIKAS